MSSNEPSAAQTGCFALITVLVLVFILGKCTNLGGDSGGSGSTSTRQTSHDPIAAYTMAEKFVTDRLKSPSTADFPWYRKEFVEHLGGGRYRVRAYVDAQNSFGGMISNVNRAGAQRTPGCGGRRDPRHCLCRAEAVPPSAHPPRWCPGTHHDLRIDGELAGHRSAEGLGRVRQPRLADDEALELRVVTPDRRYVPARNRANVRTVGVAHSQASLSAVRLPRPASPQPAMP